MRAYFVSLPTCHWVDEVWAVVNCEMTMDYSARLLDSRKLSTCHSSSVSLEIRMMGRSVSLFLYSTGKKETGVGLAANAAKRPIVLRCSDRKHK